MRVSDRTIRTFLGFRIHRAAPNLPTKVRGYLNSLLTKDDPKEGLNNYVDHEIARWYGVSFKHRWFVGVWVFGETNYPTERGPIPSYRPQGEDE